MKRLAFLLTLLIPVYTLSQIINIPNDYPTIQEGIDMAQNGDTVLVDSGTYFENINFNGKAITVASRYILNPDSTYIDNTIIDGSQPSHPDSASVVMFLSGEDTTSVLCGFTITNGKGCIDSSVFSRVGGGIVGMASGAKIIHNTISNNTLENVAGTGLGVGGGGISFLGGTSETWVIINDNIIKSNELSGTNGGFGGGIYVSSHSRIEKNIIENNTCACILVSRGGGIGFHDIFNDGFRLILKNNIIKNNSLGGFIGSGGGLAHLSGDDKSKFARNTQHNPPTPLSLIIGNIISYNEVNGNIHNYGAGIYIIRPVTDFIIISNDISFNSSTEDRDVYGGGLNMALSENNKVYIGNNKIESNTAFMGGGLWIKNANNLNLTNNLFISNSASFSGGAIHLYHYSGKEKYQEEYIPLYELNNDTVSKVERDFQHTFANNTFVNNNAEVGGAIYVKIPSYNPIIYNSIFWGNTTASENGKDISIDESSFVILYNNEIDTTGIEGSWSGVGNMFENPNFVVVGDHPYQINDYSPCIDAGTPDTTGLNLPEYDLAGEERIFNDRVDMGAYEWNTFVGIEESSIPEQDDLQVKTYPNPFTSELTLEYTTEHPQTVKITFYDSYGRTVDQIILRQQQGLQKVVWTPEGLNEGVYYFRLEAGKQIASGKVVLMK